MTRTAATLPTAAASRYLQQLAKHWGHKYPVEFTQAHADITLPLGLCRLDAGEDALEVDLTPAEDADLTRFQTLVFDWRAA